MQKAETPNITDRLPEVKAFCSFQRDALYLLSLSLSSAKSFVFMSSLQLHSPAINKIPIKGPCLGNFFNNAVIETQLKICKGKVRYRKPPHSRPKDKREQSRVRRQRQSRQQPGSHPHVHQRRWRRWNLMTRKRRGCYLLPFLSQKRHRYRNQSCWLMMVCHQRMTPWQQPGMRQRTCSVLG